MQYFVKPPILWARRCERPAAIPARRARGAKAEGLRYEAALAKALPGCAHGWWFEFEDTTGRHFCQPDILIIGLSSVLVLEAKLTWTSDGEAAIHRLYRPVLQEALGRRVVGAVVCRRLPRWHAGPIAHSLDEAAAAAQHTVSCWHWLPNTPTRVRRAA